MSELITIIVPIYNMEKYLEKCLQSLCNQTYHNTEIILVNDGSSDGSAAICEKYRQLDRRISVFHQQNRGLSAARNTGIENASGKYLCFVDADDWVDSRYCEKLYNAVVKYDTPIALCDFVKVENDDVSMTVALSTINTKCYSETKILHWLSDWKSEEYTRLVVAWNKIYDRKCFAELRYPEGILHEDEFVIHRILNGCEKLAIIEEPLYFYRQHSNSIMGRNDYETNLHHLDIVKALEDRIEFFCGKNQQAFVDAFHNYLRNVNSFYDMYRHNKDKIYNEARKNLLKRYRTYFREYKQFFDLKSYCNYAIFYYSPEVYRKICRLKSILQK